MFDSFKHHSPPFLYTMMGQQTFILTRDQIQAIAQRAAELAVEQVLGGMVPKIRPAAVQIAADDREQQLTEFERAAIMALFHE